jgi:hypothetical protein
MVWPLTFFVCRSYNNYRMSQKPDSFVKRIGNKVPIKTPGHPYFGYFPVHCYDKIHTKLYTEYHAAMDDGKRNPVMFKRVVCGEEAGDGLNT